MITSSVSLRSYIHIPNIAHKTQIKYLGIYTDQNLHWGPQTTLNLQKILQLFKN